MRHLRFTLGLLLALGVALGAACVGSVFWPVRVYELFEVAQGPYAPGYPGKAYLPSERAPNVAEMQARLQIAIPALVGAAALILAWRSGPANRTGPATDDPRRLEHRGFGSQGARFHPPHGSDAHSNANITPYTRGLTGLLPLRGEAAGGEKKSFSKNVRFRGKKCSFRRAENFPIVP